MMDETEQVHSIWTISQIHRILHKTKKRATELSTKLMSTFLLGYNYILFVLPLEM